MDLSKAHGAKRLARQDDWIEPLARLGYTAKGIVYGLVGVLAVRAAIGSGGSTSGSTGALRTIEAQPFGRILLGLTAVGLLGYAVWRLAQAVRDPDREGTDAKGMMKRIAYGVSGLIYVGLAFLAGRMALSSGSGGGGASRQTWTAQLLAQPFGQWLVGLVGLVIVAVGLFHFYQVYTASFMRRYEVGGMDARERTWARRIGQFGLGARGVTFCIIGGFFLQAALQSDADEARGLGAAFDTLARQPFGKWLLALVAAGFVAYGVYCFSRARYRRFATG